MAVVAVSPVVIAFVFPGQGAQAVGMGKALADQFEVCAQTFAEADAALGESLSELIFNGPTDRLTLTENTQPAILTMSVAVCRLLADARRHAGVRRRPQPGRVFGARRGGHAAVRRRGAAGAQPRPLHAGGRAGRRRRDGGDHRPRRGRREPGLRGSGAGRGGEPRQPERRRADRDRRHAPPRSRAPASAPRRSAPSARFR